jgi:hypothetical protein
MIRGVYNPNTGKVDEVDENKTKTAFNDFKDVISKGISIMLEDFNVDEREAALAMSDLISLVLKAPMLLPPLRYTGRVPENANNFETLANYVLQRHIKGKVSPDKVTEVVKGNWGAKGNSNKNLFLRFISLFQDKIYSVYEALMTVPADSRPGNNIGSLAAHLSISSMAEWAIFPDSQDLPFLRLATVLHDIGKLTDFGRHWESSTDFFDGLIDEIQKNTDINPTLRSGLVDVLRKAEERARKHHLVNIEGDLISSGEGRIERSELEQLYSFQHCSPFRETLHMKASEAEDYINELEKEDKSLKDKYEECSKQVYKKLQERQRSSKKDDIDPSQNVIADLNMFNFPGVQSFIKSFSDLRDISAASTLVDMSVTTIPFVVIDSMYDKTYLPLDSLLVSSGGHSFIVTRRDSSNVNESRIEEELRKVTLLHDLNVSLTVSSTPLIVGNDPYRMRGYKPVSELFGKDGVRGLKISPSSFKIVSPGLHAVCESCGVYPAVEIDERGKRLCRRCFTVHEISKSKGFSSKLKASFKIGSVDISPPKEALIDPMSYLSGDLIDEGEGKKYEPVKAPRGYLSVVKSDGNDAGEYFSSSLNFDEYIDKSFKVDYWVKKGFVEAADEAEKDGVLNKGMIMRTLLGVQYMGGDDILLIGPAMTAPILTMNALEKATSKLGMSFKVGVATVKSDTPIQFAIDAADKLMEDGKIEKETVRGTTNNDGVKNEQERNTLTFLFASSLVTRSSVEEIKREWSADPLSSTHNQKEEEKVSTMYKMKTNFSFWKDIIALSDDLKLVLKSFPNDYEKRVKSFKDYVRVMEDIVETFHRTKDPYYTVIYMMRQSTRHKEASKLMLALLKGWDKEGQIPLVDAFYMFKAALVEAGDRGESS